MEGKVERATVRQQARRTVTKPTFAWFSLRQEGAIGVESQCGPASLCGAFGTDFVCYLLMKEYRPVLAGTRT